MVVRRGVLDHPGQHRGLGVVEVLGVDAEVVLGSGLDAEGAVTEVGGVEVALEDPVLGVLLLQRDGVAQFLELAGVAGHAVGDDRCLLLLLALRLVDQGELDQLLGDRRTTLDGPAIHLVGHQRAHRALQVQRSVLVEAVVLDRDDRLEHLAADLGERDLDPVLVVELGDHVALAVDDLGPLREVGGLELLGQVVHRPGHVAGTDPRDAGERDHQTGRDQPHQCAATSTITPRCEAIREAGRRSLSGTTCLKGYGSSTRARIHEPPAPAPHRGLGWGYQRTSHF